MNKLVNEWIQYAEADLASSELQKNRSGLYHISVYQSHQAVEKIIKAYLIHQHIEDVPKIHDLRKLTIIAKQHGLDISAEQKSVLDLDSFFPKLRYPFGDQINAENAARCYEIAERLVDTIKSIITEQT